MNPEKIKKNRSKKSHEPDPARNDTFDISQKQQIKKKRNKIVRKSRRGQG